MSFELHGTCCVLTLIHNLLIEAYEKDVFCNGNTGYGFNGM